MYNIKWRKVKQAQSYSNVITTSLVRLQPEQQMAKARQANALKSQESQISKYYKALLPFPNTIIPHRYIVRYPREYQGHLQGISDFLLCGEGDWWKHVVAGVEFLDGMDHLSFRPQGPSLHHFRSSNLKLEEQHLKQCWDVCLADDAIKIPHRVIRLCADNGDCNQVINTNVLNQKTPQQITAPSQQLHLNTRNNMKEYQVLIAISLTRLQQSCARTLQEF